MADTAKLFMHGRSQAVRLPKEFRMPGNEVRVTKIGNRVVLEPITPESKATPWTIIDSLGDRPFMPEGREQPALPDDERRIFDQ
jgi:antitoxin VapB